MTNAPRHTRKFSWRDTTALLEELLDDFGLEPSRFEFEPPGSFIAVSTEEADGTSERQSIRFTPPAVHLARLRTAQLDPTLFDDSLGWHAIALVRAGSAALGLWDGDELIAHKAFKRYVVRGNGKAQATHLNSKGKSRYGSRLRLQQAKALLQDVTTRLVEWTESFGAFERVDYACPVRLWAELLATQPAAPFSAHVAPVKITLDTREPSHEELLRVRRLLTAGRIEWSGGVDS